MSPSNDERRANARRNAQNAFTSTEQRDAALRKEIETERARSAAKTARLRALRLAKEAADKAEAERLALLQPQAPSPRAERKVKRIPTN